MTTDMFEAHGTRLPIVLTEETEESRQERLCRVSSGNHLGAIVRKAASRAMSVRE